MWGVDLTDQQRSRPAFADVDARSALSPEVRRFQRSWHFEIFDQAWRFYERKQLRKAIELAAEAVRIDPDVSRSWVGFGVMLMEAERTSRAIACFRRALKLRPQYAGAWSQLGEALRRSNRPLAAIVCHERATSLCPEEAIFHYRKGRALVTQGKDAEAIPVLDHAASLDPDFLHPLWERGECRRRLGDYAAGWADYELRFDPRLEKSKPLCDDVRWNGEPFVGKTLFVLTEQGFGDNIWAARYLPRVKALGGRVVVQCRRELASLLGRLDAVDEVVGHRDPAPPHDLYVPICSLPGMFTPGVDAIPTAPYMVADRSRLAKFAPWLGLANGRMKIGLIWSGSVHFSGNAARSLMLQAMLDAFDLPAVQLYALQKSAPSSQVTRAAPELQTNRIIDLGPLLDDFADTAAVVSELDLLIMTDSSTAHLAGSLGRPVWVLLNHVSYWLWGQNRSTTPWYPSARLFRAATPNAWDGPLDAAAAALMTLVGERTRQFDQRGSSLKAQP